MLSGRPTAHREHVQGEFLHQSLSNSRGSHTILPCGAQAVEDGGEAFCVVRYARMETDLKAERSYRRFFSLLVAGVGYLIAVADVGLGLTQAELDKAAHSLNRRPRQTLDGMTSSDKLAETLQ